MLWFSAVFSLALVQPSTGDSSLVVKMAEQHITRDEGHISGYFEESVAAFKLPERRLEGFRVTRFDLQTTYPVAANDGGVLFVYSGVANGKKIVIPDLNRDKDFTNDPLFEYSTQRKFREAANDSAQTLAFDYEYRVNGRTIPRQTKVKVLPFEPYLFFARTDEEMLRVFLKRASYKSGEIDIGDAKYRFSLHNPFEFDAAYEKAIVEVHHAVTGAQVKFSPPLRSGDAFLLDGTSITVDSVSHFGESVFLNVRSDQTVFGVRERDFLHRDLYNDIKGEIGINRGSAGNNRFVLMDFWGSWCGPCIESIPVLRRIYETYELKHKGILMLSVAKEASPRDTTRLNELILGNKMEWAHRTEFLSQSKKQNKFTSELNIQNFPTVLLIDNEGKIVMRRSGIDGVVEVEKKLSELIWSSR